MLNIISKIASIREAFKKSLLLDNLFAVEIEKLIEECGLKNPDVGLDFELAFRGLLEEFLLNPDNIDKIASEKSDIIRLLKLSMRFGLKYHTVSPNIIPKIPFLLIEDLLSQLTIFHAEEVWKLIEAMRDTLTLPDLFAKGKFVILRTCNALLKKLSKSCNSEFCGRVMLFLSSIYPLSERSAVNLNGKVNTSNATEFDDEKSFNLHFFGTAEGEVCDADAGVDKMEVEAAESAQTASVPSGQQVTDQMDVTTPNEDLTSEAAMISDAAKAALGTGGLSGEEGEEAEAAAAKTVPKAEPPLPAVRIQYQLYEAMWRLQSFTASELKALDSEARWVDFLTTASVVLTTFETRCFSEQELAQARLRQTEARQLATDPVLSKQSKCKTSDTAEFVGAKYLTSPQLFTLQLRDPKFRLQMAAQILFFLHSIRSRPPSTSYAPPDLDMNILQNRAVNVIQATPGGEQFYLTLHELLDREAVWIAWKLKACPNFERPAAETLPTPAAEDPAVLRKRKRQEGRPGMSVTAYYMSLDEAMMKETAKRITENVPSYEAHIKRFEEAEDPEAGIEEEYHPKNDGVYAWRARRLLAAKKVVVFEAMGDGDISKGVKKLHDVVSGKDKDEAVDQAAVESKPESDGLPGSGHSESSAKEGEAPGLAEQHMAIDEQCSLDLYGGVAIEESGQLVEGGLSEVGSVPGNSTSESSSGTAQKVGGEEGEEGEDTTSSS